MKIAITGGAGFIGTRLTKAYLDAGHTVFVIDRLNIGSREAVDPRARLYTVDIRDWKLQHILRMERPDVVSHHAAERADALTGAQPLADADVHIHGLLNVLESCVQASVSTFIFASGGNTLYGHVEPNQLPVTEDTTLCPRLPSDISKVAGEWYVRYYTQQYRLAHTILRYADVYGETDRHLAQHPLTSFIYALLEQRHPVIRGVADEVRDHIYIDDVIQANLRILTQSQNTTMHISSGQGQTLNQLYRIAADLLQSEVEPTYISRSLTEAVSSIIMDNTRAQHILRWHPKIDLAEGIRQLIEQIREQTKQHALATVVM